MVLFVFVNVKQKTNHNVLLDDKRNIGISALIRGGFNSFGPSVAD